MWNEHCILLKGPLNDLRASLSQRLALEATLSRLLLYGNSFHLTYLFGPCMIQIRDLFDNQQFYNVTANIKRLRPQTSLFRLF